MWNPFKKRDILKEDSLEGCEARASRLFLEQLELYNSATPEERMYMAMPFKDFIHDPKSKDQAFFQRILELRGAREGMEFAHKEGNELRRILSKY